MTRRPAAIVRGGRGTVVALAVVAVVLLAATWAVIEPRTLWIERAVVTSPTVPESLDGVRIAYLSDVHSGGLLGAENVNEAMSDVAGLRPDVIVMGGDYEDETQEPIDAFYPALESLSRRYSVIAVLGNHDALGDRGETVTRRLEDAGAIVLRNDRARLRFNGGSLRVAGIDDTAEGGADVAAATREIAKDEFVVGVSHRPDAFADAAAYDTARHPFGLMLAGHTHGGQVTLFGLWAPVVPSRYGQTYRTGWNEIDGAPILTSNGVGVYKAPLRFFAPPQVHLIELRRGKASVERSMGLAR